MIHNAPIIRGAGQFDGGGTFAEVANGENILAPKFWVPWVGEAFLDMIAAMMVAIYGH